MQTITLAQRLEEDMNSLVSHSAKLEMNNTQLKQAIRMMAKTFQKDDNGNNTKLTQEEANFVKRVVDENNVFPEAPSLQDVN